MNITPQSHQHPKLAIGFVSIFNNLAKTLKQNGSIVPKYVAFPILSAVFTYYLWIVMGHNGAAQALQATIGSGRHADGTPLLATYTGIRPLDQLIQVIVAFEYPVTTGQDKPSWLLMLDIMSTLQSSIVWISMDSMRKGRSSAWLAYPTLWCFAINAIGAAVVLPIYFWLQLQHRPKEAYIQLWDAAPLPFAYIVGGVLPGLALVTRTILPRSAVTHQQIIAVVQASPLIVAIIQSVGSSLYPIRNLDIRRRRTAALPSLQRVLAFCAVFSGLAHLIILGSSIYGTASLSSIFAPDAAATPTAADVNKLLQGARYFLQWDLLGIAASTGLWCYHLLSESSEMNTMALVTRLVGGMLLFGPGATTSAILSWREGQNVAKAEAKRKSRLV